MCCSDVRGQCYRLRYTVQSINNMWNTYTGTKWLFFFCVSRADEMAVSYLFSSVPVLHCVSLSCLDSEHSRLFLCLEMLAHQLGVEIMS